MGSRDYSDAPCRQAPEEMVGSTRLVAWLLALLLTLASATCTRDAPTLPGTDPALLPRVVVISIDGLRPDAIAAANAATLLRLIAEGAATLTAQSVVPSLTLPSHASMLTGVTPSRHGILFNDDVSSQSQPLEMSTFVDLTNQAGYTGALFMGKSKLRLLVHPNSLTTASIPPTGQIWLADQVTSQMLAYLSGVTTKPSLIVIHLPDVDLKGHEFGWLSAEYMDAVRHVDDDVARIWQGLRQAYGADLTLIVTADHGGTDHGHSDGSAQSMTIPWIAWGRSVLPQRISGQVRVLDTAPTVLWLLKVPVPAGLDGAPIVRAFQPSAP